MLLTIRKPWNHPLLKDLLKELNLILRVHTILITLIFLYVTALLFIASQYNVIDKISFSLYSKDVQLMTALFLVSFFIGHALYVMAFIRPEKLISYTFQDLWMNYLNRKRILNALPIMLLLPLFMSTFTSFKSMIPIINPFSWDHAFAELDALIGGGFQSWKLLHPIFGRPLLTSVINFFYNVWPFYIFAVLYWQSFSMSNPRLRMRFFLTFTLSWVLLGTVLATLLSSAGPCFYGRVVEGDNLYHPLMEYLMIAQKSYPIWAIDTQETLWQLYKDSGVSLGSGISAMPSMHVSMAFLFALVGWQTHRIVGIIFSAYSILIMIGSVHLGWHYAVDGYIAICGTWFIWRVVGFIITGQSRI